MVYVISIRVFVRIILIVSTTISIAPSSTCHAFKPSLTSILWANKGATAIIDDTTTTSNELFIRDNVSSLSSSGEVANNIVRGGHHPEEEGRFHLHKGDVLRYHGYLLIFLAATSFLETVGVKIPLVGPSALIPGFNGEEDAMKFVARFSSAVMLSRGLMEIEFSTSVAAQYIFIRIITLVFLLSTWTYLEIGAKGIQWSVPGLAVLFMVGFLVGK